MTVKEFCPCKRTETLIRLIEGGAEIPKVDLGDAFMKTEELLFLNLLH